MVVPALEGVLVSGAGDLPFGLSSINGLTSGVLLAAALTGTFLLCCVIFYTVPKGHVPWHGVWAGALFVTFTTGVANAVYPFYLANVRASARSGARSASYSSRWSGSTWSASR